MLVISLATQDCDNCELDLARRIIASMRDIKQTYMPNNDRVEDTKHPSFAGLFCTDALA